MSGTFNGHGYIAPGLHPMAQSDLEAAFVTAFPHSSTRGDIMKGYKKHSLEVTALVGACEQLLDGSFVTNKNDPGDVDMVLFVDASVIDNLSSSQKAEFAALTAGQQTKATHLCDAYFCPTYPETHPQFQQFRQIRKYWMGEFGFDRQEVPKGIVQVQLAPPAPPPPCPIPTVPASGPTP
ncbi:DUF6932 family protein [Bradyrhizobium sp. HKCCYLS2038]|uniref:DUF6932 family protein n=1 Tax=unclassified Bradyrhizobium TaxID=2631580 RepID=UPI003EBA7883